MNHISKKIKSLSPERLKYPVILLALGVLLLLFPGDSARKQKAEEPPSLSELLADTRGVGKCRTLVSDKGVIVVCEGADNARVRLEIIHALSSYTGYSSNKITILKMAE